MLKNGINEIKIKSYDELVKLIRGKDKRTKHDLRKDFIFRGLSNVEYELIPSSLRKNNLNQLEINKLIEPTQKFKVSISKTDAEKHNLNYIEQDYDDRNVIVLFDKYGVPIDDKNSKYRAPENKLQTEREFCILMKFLNYADKSGLKVNAEGFSRDLLHYKTKEPYDESMNSNTNELMSLAQHYGLPTKALDWSYDYKVSLYFAVKDILTCLQSNNGVLWALNYKLIENHELNDKNYYVNLSLHRPEYNTNPNLNAQKGLFTYLEQYDKNYDTPLDKLISSELNQKLENRPFFTYYQMKTTTIPTNITKNNTIFYKFIIPKEIKPQILKELYLDGYSEEYLFPGYDGVTQSVINRIKLNNLLNETKTSKKNILLNGDWDMDEVKNKEKLYEFVECDFDCEIDKIFICKDNKVLGYFIGNEIINDSPKNLWDKFGEFSGLYENELKDSTSSAVRINDLHLFKYPIKLHDFELTNEFCYIEEDDENLNFLLNFSYIQ